MIILSKAQVLKLHTQLIDEFGGIDCIRDMGLFESAIYAPFQVFGETEAYPTLQEKGARLGYGLIKNHAFIDGNKRIGALITQLLLKWNGYRLVLQKNELADMFIAIADGQAGEEDLLNWIRNHIH